MINANRVQEILFDCFLNKNEIKNDKPAIPFIKVMGIVRNFGFNPDRIAKHKQEIKEMLDQIENLPEGISFLAFGVCKDSGSNLWGGHVNFEQLIVLGIAAGYLYYPLPRTAWSALPGGVPYVCYDQTGDHPVDIENPAE